MIYLHIIIEIHDKHIRWKRILTFLLTNYSIIILQLIQLVLIILDKKEINETDFC